MRVWFAHGEPAAPVRLVARMALEQTLPGSATGIVEDALLILTELIQNVRQHTRSDGRLTISTTPGSILIEVADQDPGRPQPQSVDRHRAGGRGLLLVAAVAADWGVRDDTNGGKVMWVRLATDG